MKTQNTLKGKSCLSARRTIKCNRFLQTDNRKLVLPEQLLRSGTCTGANIGEAEQVQSKTGFIHKLPASFKGTNEIFYWFERPGQPGYLKKNEFERIDEDCIELIKLLTAGTKNSKSNLGS